MSKIEWERQPDGIIAGDADFVRYQAYEGEQETWQRIHDARVTEIAAANGYIRLEPGQVVVDAAEVGDALDALCDTCAGECSMCRVKDVLSAIKEARDE